MSTECVERLPAWPAAATAAPARMARIWGVAGVSALFGRATWQLGKRGIETVSAGLSPLEWGVLAALTAVFVYGEGYRALQLKWLPRVFGRLSRLDRAAPLASRALAPLYAMGLLGVPLRTAARGWLGVGAIGLAVVVVSRFPAPWRGITDLAVAAALAWALAVLLVQCARGHLLRGA